MAQEYSRIELLNNFNTLLPSNGQELIDANALREALSAIIYSTYVKTDDSINNNFTTSPWNSNLPYSVGFIVEYQDKFWKSKIADNTNIVPVEGANWTEVSKATAGQTIDLSGYFTKLELKTAGQSEVHWDNITQKPTIPTGEVSTGNKIIWVSKAGNDSTAQKGRLDKTFLTIQSAVNQAVSGDTIIVLAGTYTENVSNIPANCNLIVDNSFINGNITNLVSANNVTIIFKNSVINGVPNANNNVTGGKVLLYNSVVNAGNGTLSGTFSTFFWGDNDSTINAGTIGGLNGNGNVVLEGLTLNAITIFNSGLIKNCKIKGTIYLPDAGTGDIFDCEIDVGQGIVFLPSQSYATLKSLKNCQIKGNYLFFEQFRTINFEAKHCSFFLNQTTFCGGGNIKMIGCDCNLSKVQLAGNATITDYFSQFNF
jgi:hypothetical protein